MQYIQTVFEYENNILPACGSNRKYYNPPLDCTLHTISYFVSTWLSHTQLQAPFELLRRSTYVCFLSEPRIETKRSSPLPRQPTDR